MSAEPADPGQGPLLLDTHVVLWSTLRNARLGGDATKAINLGAREDRILISAITPWEIGLLVIKKRVNLERDVMDWIRGAVGKPGVHLAPLEPEIAVASTRLPFEMNPDPADRILVATARHLGATLVTADRGLLDLAGKGYFKTMDASA